MPTVSSSTLSVTSPDSSAGWSDSLLIDSEHRACGALRSQMHLASREARFHWTRRDRSRFGQPLPNPVLSET